MMYMVRVALLASVAVGMSVMPASADEILGAKVFSAPGGGVKIKSVAKDSNAFRLGLKKGEIILTIGNPDENVPDMLVQSQDDLEQALLGIGDSVRLLVKKGSSFFFVSGQLEGVDDVSLPSTEDQADTTFLVAVKKDKDKGKSKGKGPLENVHKKKPRTVSQLLSKHKKSNRSNVRVVPGSKKSKPTHTPKWHASAKKDKDKGKGTSKGKSTRKDRKSATLTPHFDNRVSARTDELLI